LEVWKIEKLRGKNIMLSNRGKKLSKKKSVKKIEKQLKRKND